MDLTEALLVALLLGLGTARASAIITIDVISEPLRDLIFHWFPPEDNDAAGHYYQQMRKATSEERKRSAKWRIPWWQKRWEADGSTRNASFIGQLLSCQKCAGVWIAAANTVAYLLVPEATVAFNAFLAASFIGAVANIRYYR